MTSLTTSDAVVAKCATIRDDITYSRFFLISGEKKSAHTLESCFSFKSARMAVFCMSSITKNYNSFHLISSNSPLVRHLLMSWQPGLHLSLFDPHTFSSIGGTRAHFNLLCHLGSVSSLAILLKPRLWPKAWTRQATKSYGLPTSSQNLIKKLPTKNLPERNTPKSR